MDVTTLHIVGIKRKVSIPFAVIKAFIALEKIFSRTEADDQTRQSFVEFASDSTVSTVGGSVRNVCKIVPWRPARESSEVNLCT